MYNAFIAFIAILILGAIIYGTAWWNGSVVGWKFTKWFFIVTLAAALVVGVLTLAGVIQF